MIDLPEDSPVFWLPKACELQPDEQVTFLVYSVAAPGAQWESPRTLHRVAVADISKFLESTLEPGFELSLCSAIYRHYHHPTPHAHFQMADWARHLPEFTPPPGAESFAAWDDEDLVSIEPVFYDSGNALHAYWPHVTSAHKWPAFIGELLTAKADSGEPYVDVRAAGYALRRGYSAPRLTKNTERYLKAPTRLLLS